MNLRLVLDVKIIGKVFAIVACLQDIADYYGHQSKRTRLSGMKSIPIHFSLYQECLGNSQ